MAAMTLKKLKEQYSNMAKGNTDFQGRHFVLESTRTTSGHYLVKLFSKLDENSNLLTHFGAGQKNNPSHGPVAQVTMAPMYICHYLNH